MASSYVPIPLQVQAPAPTSLLSSVGAFQNIRDQISQIALRHAQTEQANQQAQEYQVQAAQRNRDLADQNTVQEVEKDPGSYAKIASGDLSPVIGKVQDATVQKLRASVNTALQNEATRTTEELAQRGSAHANIGTSLASLQQMRAPDGSLDIGRVNEALPGVIQGLMPDLKILGLDSSKVPDSVTDEDHLKLLTSRLGAAAALTSAAQKIKSEQATAAEAAGRGAQATAEANLANFRLDLMKGLTDPASIGANVDKLIDPVAHPQANADAKAAASLAAKSGDPAKVTEAVKSIYDEQVGKPEGGAAAIAAETPGKVAQQAAMLPGQIRQAGAEAQARIPAEVAGRVQSAQALAQQAPAAFSGIIDPSERDAVMKDTATARNAYADSLNQTQTILDTLKAEQSGNKVAGSALTVDQARSLVTSGRQLGSVLHQVSGNSGNLIDSIEGKLQGLAGTDKLPPDVAKSIGAFTVITQQAAKRKYESDLDSLAMRGLDKSKIAPPSISSGPQVGDIVKIDGKKIKISAIYADGTFDGNP